MGFSGLLIGVAVGGASLVTDAAVAAPAGVSAPADAPVDVAPGDAAPPAEIVVTGQRSDEPVSKTARLGVLGDRDILDTPYSINSLTEEFARNIQAVTLTDILRRDASVSEANPGFADDLRIRGFSVPFNRGATFDGLPNLVANVTTTELIGRVDILKGPSAFLTGALGAIGGNLNIVPKRADDSDLNRFTAQFLSRGTIGGAIDVSRRFGAGKAFGIRVNAGYREGEAVLRGSHDRRIFGAIALDYRGDDVRAFVDISYERDHLRGYNYYTVLGPALTTVPATPDASGLMQPPWMASNQPYQRTQGRIEWDFAPGWTVSGAFGRGYQDDQGYGWGYCGTVTIVNPAGDATCDPIGGTSDRRLLSGLVSLNGTIRTGPLTHRLTIVYNATDEFSKYSGNSTAPLVNFNIYTKMFPARPPITLGPKVRRLRFTTSGVTIGDDISLLDDRVIVTVGARHAEFRNRLYALGTGAPATNVPGDRWTPAAGLVVKPAANISLYGNYVEALEAGGTAPANAANPNAQLPARKSDQIEIGAKADLAGVRASIAAFRINRANDYLNLATNLFGRFGLQRNKGIELSLSGTPLPGLNLVANTMYLDAKLRKTVGGLLDGKRASGSPRWQGSLSADWAPAALGGVGLNLGLIYTGATFVNDANSFELGGWTRIDAGARYAFALGDKRLTARANVANLFDRDRWLVIYSGGAINPAPPRTVQLSLALDL